MFTITKEITKQLKVNIMSSTNTITKVSKKTSLLSKVNKLAHYLLKNHKADYPTWRDAITMAWKTIKVRKELNSKLCHFSFVKSTGEHRLAWGHTMKGYYNYDFAGGGWKKWNVIRFWDINLNKWRSFRIERLVAMVW